VFMKDFGRAVGDVLVLSLSRLPKNDDGEVGVVGEAKKNDDGDVGELGDAGLA